MSCSEINGSTEFDTFRRVDGITGVSGRRRWSPEEKERIVRESYDPLTTVGTVAERHAINRNQLFRWRRQLRRDGGIEGNAVAPFARVVSADGSGCGAALPMIEIMIGALCVRVRSDADPRTLQMVIDVVRRST